ncbi:hypothetical protein NL676_007288 [Syzygium grande]|nr:hypothetical protein NL676_007288 [Syzygium grande]
MEMQHPPQTLNTTPAFALLRNFERCQHLPPRVTGTTNELIQGQFSDPGGPRSGVGYIRDRAFRKPQGSAQYLYGY